MIIMTGYKEEIPSPPIKVSKLEGAERLLNTAIQLFFDAGDMLSVHVLVAGAHEVLRTLLSNSGVAASLIKDNPTIRPEKLKEVRSQMNRTQNFLKHADKDPDSILDYYEAGIPFWIYDAIRMHSKLPGSSKYRAFFIFQIWFLREYPTVVSDPTIEAKLLELKNCYPTSRTKLGEMLKNPDIYPIRDHG